MIPSCTGEKKASDSRRDNGTVSIIYPDTNRFCGQKKIDAVMFSYKSAEAN